MEADATGLTRVTADGTKAIVTWDAPFGVALLASYGRPTALLAFTTPTQTRYVPARIDDRSEEDDELLARIAVLADLDLVDGIAHDAALTVDRDRSARPSCRGSRQGRARSRLPERRQGHAHRARSRDARGRRAQLRSHEPARVAPAHVPRVDRTGRRALPGDVDQAGRLRGGARRADARVHRSAREQRRIARPAVGSVARSRAICAFSRPPPRARPRATSASRSIARS